MYCLRRLIRVPGQKFFGLAALCSFLSGNGLLGLAWLLVLGKTMDGVLLSEGMLLEV